MTTPAKHRGVSLTALLFGVVLIVAVVLASVLDSPELGTAVGTVGLALGTLWLAAGARDQATLARQALDAQTQPFLTAVDDPDPAGLAGEAMPAQSGREGESVRWRLG